MILGVDAGNYKAKVVGAYGIDSYRTAICDWFERDVIEQHGSDDMEFSIDGRKGFAGTIAENEDEFGGGSMFGDSKAHDDTKVRVLLAVHRYIEKYAPGVEDISLVTGQPITTHKESEKDKIKEMLEGHHNFTVNRRNVNINIKNVGIAAEGGGAYWSNPQQGRIRIIDVGSGTVNAATINNNKFINNASDTFNFGMETVNNKSDLESVARAIIRATSRLKWSKTDNVYLCGGIAGELLPHIYGHYLNAKLLQPILQEGENITVLDPVYANAVGFYKLARNAFQ